MIKKIKAWWFRKQVRAAILAGIEQHLSPQEPICVLGTWRWNGVFHRVDLVLPDLGYVVVTREDPTLRDVVTRAGFYCVEITSMAHVERLIDAIATAAGSA